MPVYNGRKFKAGFMGTAVVYGATAFGSLSFANGVYTFTPPSLPVTGGFELPLKTWSNSGGDATIVTIKNSLSGKQPLKDATFDDERSIQLILDYDFATGSGANVGNPFIAANAGLISGATIQNLVLFLDQTKRSGLDGSFWYYSSIIVKGTPQRVIVEGEVSLMVNAEASGPWFPPGVLTA